MDEPLAPARTVRGRALKKRLTRRLPWLLLAWGLVALVSVLTLWRPLPRLDRILQDRAHLQMPDAPSDAIVIVAIDERSLQALGRWPWRRSLHAELLRRIDAQAPRCVGVNMLLSEPDLLHPQDDVALASAIASSGCIVLPTARQLRDPLPPAELLPLPQFESGASAIGHVHLSTDDDGVARRVYMREGFEGRLWPHFTLALEQAAQARAAGTAGVPRAQLQARPLDTSRGNGPWLREDHEVLLFNGNPTAYKTVSYIDVLRGLVPADQFRQRYVLIGATAAGLGDQISTPNGLIAGVQIFANLLQAQLERRRVTVAQPWQDLAYNLAPLAVALLSLLWLRPLAVVGVIGLLLVAWLSLYSAWPWAGVQFAPSAGFIGVLLVYPLWSLMRLGATLRYLRQSTQQINEAMAMLPDARPLDLSGDFLDREMAITTAAARRMRDLHRFVRDGIDHMADATLVLDRTGRVLIANLSAARHWNTTAALLLHRDAHELLADLRWRANGLPMLPAGTLGPDKLATVLGEGGDAAGRVLLLRCVPFFNASNQHFGWMVVLVDISTMRQAQSQRDEALRFISHDIREPSASIITALELARTRPELLDTAQLHQRIERHARTGLELADGFVNLARAEAQPFRAEVLDLVALQLQGIDNAWADARRRRVVVQHDAEHDEALCVGDRSLLSRALSNVLSNALKYSPPNAEVHCTVRKRDGFWALSVRDEGPGIPPELQTQLFQPFHRLHRESHPEVHGIGLGLLQVRTAVQRHGGSVEIDSAAGAGCTVTLLLPRPGDHDIESSQHLKEST